MIDVSRSKGFFDPEKQSIKIKVVGAGSVGSWVVLGLAKMGFRDIDVWDFDTVEVANVSPQLYRKEDLGKTKVEALKQIVKEFADTDINIHNEKIEAGTNLPIDLNSVWVFCLDSLEARKLIYEKIKRLPIPIVDARMGGEGYNIQVILNSEQKAEYEKSLTGEAGELPCGLKAVCYTNLSLAGETVNILKRLNNKENVPRIMFREMKAPEILAGT